VISKRLLELMDSELCLESATNKGSQFWFELPMPS
jgi:signal transduction histidine kinase